MTGAELIAEERARQVAKEGWDAKHDDEHCNGELAAAAACYAINAANGKMAGYQDSQPPPWWPWDDEWWKPKDRKRDLVRAGALIAAELDRMGRNVVRAETPHGE